VAAATWNHPTLGRFEHDGMRWTRTVDVPAFKAFSYDTGYDTARRSKGKHQLAFGALTERDLPTDAQIAVADRVLANHAGLVGIVIDALWEDLNGRGPDSRAWHDNLEGVAKSFKFHKLPPPTKPQDLLPVLQVSRLDVNEGFPGHDAGPLVELEFHALFDIDHGLTVLTDGRSVMGIGANGDVVPFGWKPPAPPRFG
jgi:hypothetical protein